MLDQSMTYSTVRVEITRLLFISGLLNGPGVFSPLCFGITKKTSLNH